MLEIPHLLWVLPPLLNDAYSGIFFPCVSLEFPLFWLVSVALCLFTGHLWEEMDFTFFVPSHQIVVGSSKVSSEPFLLQAERGCPAQLLFLHRVLYPQPPWWPSVGLNLVCQCLHCVWKPKAVHSFQSVATPVLKREEGSLPWPAGFILATAQYEVGKGALLSWVHLVSTRIPGPFLQSCSQDSCLPVCTAAWGYSIPAHLNDGKGVEYPGM